ncbi:MAG TPA: hypothetical protein VK524_11655 [Polyangiaceae bacterium]|nr:hypothetical protein [Polyangiaceae bacterium]
MFSSRRASRILQLVALFAAARSVPEAHAEPMRATSAGLPPPYVAQRGARTQAAPGPASWVPLAGLLIHPYASDDSFGAGFQVGVRHGFASLLFRENFARSTQHAEDGELERLKSRVSFELSLEAQARIRQFRPYAGAGALIRRDTWQWTRIEEQRFVSRSERELLARPFVVAGLIGSVLEANVMLMLQEEPELRVGLGFVVGR